MTATSNHIPEKKIIKTIRMSEDLVLKLEKKAKNEHRNFSNMVVAVLTDFVGNDNQLKVPFQ